MVAASRQGDRLPPMPDPAKLLVTVRRAIQAVLDQPGRVGHLVNADCDEILIAGDMHGHVPNFKTVLMAAELGKHPRRHLVLQELIHGPFEYPNGGEKSHQLVDLFCALKCQYPDRVHYLPGNHELAQLNNRPIGKGETTCNSLFRFGVEAAYGVEPAREIYDRYMDLIRALPLAIKTPNRIFISHSLPASKYLPTFQPSIFTKETYSLEDFQPGGSVYAVVWGRETTAEICQSYLKSVQGDWLVSGHIPLETGARFPSDRHVIVDCSVSPMAYTLLPTTREITHAEFQAAVTVV
jgi:hypothetical protein